MLNIRSPIQSNLNIERLKSIIDTLKRKIDSGEVNSQGEAAAEAMAAFRNFFLSIGTPNTQYNKLTGGPTSSESYNKTMDAIQADISAMYSEIDSIQTSQTEVFNFTKVSMEEIKNRLSEATSKIVDLNLLHNLLNQDVLIGGDDFLDTGFIDFHFPLQSTQADVLTSSGIVVLKRTGTHNVATASTKAKIIPIQPAGLVTTPTIDNTNRFYEGDYYDYAERARSEGGRWHLEMLVDADDVAGPTGDTSFEIRGRTTLDELQNALDRVTPIPDVEDFIVIDLGASEEEKDTIRQKMFDGDPTSWWESEYVITTRIPLIDKDEILNNSNQSNHQPGRGPNNNDPRNSRVEINLDPNLLRQRALAQDTEDLTIEVLVELENEETLNFISLNPFNFGESAWLEVLSLELASADSNFRLIPGFSNGVFDNTITNEANEFVNSTEQAQTLAPNQFSYKGQGIWSFPAQRAKLVKFTLRQRVPVPDPYHRMHILMSRTIQKTKISEGSSSMM